MTDAVEALLGELLAEVRALRRDLARVTPAPTDLLARLLPAIAGARGSEPFAARDLEDEHPELVPIIAGRSPKAIGRVLAEAEGMIVQLSISFCFSEMPPPTDAGNCCGMNVCFYEGDRLDRVVLRPSTIKPLRSD